MGWRSRWASVLAGVVALLACAALWAVAAPLEAVDDRGQVISLDQEPQRIVALGAFYAQMAVDLGLAGRVVGLGDSEDNPADLTGAASVGPVYAPSVEMILSLSPDVVLGATDWNGDRAALEAAGICVYTAPRFASVDGVLDAALGVGSLLGRGAAAEILVAGLRASLAESAAAARGKSALRVAYVYAPTGDAIYAMGKGTPEDDLLTLAGTTNVFADVSGYSQVSLEALVARDPDVVITDPTQMGSLTGSTILSGLRAVAAGRVVGVPARWVSSTQVAQALQQIVAGLHGG